MQPGSRAAAARTAITGYVLKLIRESIPRSQERLATDLGVDRATVQSWEAGRRPFTSVAFGQAIAVRHKLARLGADGRLLALLDEAAEADYLLDATLNADPTHLDLDQHPLGWTVLTHSLTELMAWAVVPREPAMLDGMRRPANRRGPVANAPVLDSAGRTTFFNNLHVIADRTAHHAQAHVLLHRQACFLAGLDPTGQSVRWLSTLTSRTDFFNTFYDWSPQWPAARSVAVSLANQGDPQALREFIARAHPDDVCEIAGLNYFAYWVGEVADRKHDDLFMRDTSMSWRGGRLLHHLVRRLTSDRPFLDLNIHTVWALLAARHGLIHDDPSVGRDLVVRAENVLDAGEISTQSRRELTSILYGLRMSGLTAKGRTDDGH